MCAPPTFSYGTTTSGSVSDLCFFVFSPLGSAWQQQAYTDILRQRNRRGILYPVFLHFPPARQAEEAWSMLTAGLLYGRNGGSGSEGWDRGERALSLDFFLRLVRALGRHLAPISVPSPLVRYCSAYFSKY